MSIRDVIYLEALSVLCAILYCTCVRYACRKLTACMLYTVCTVCIIKGKQRAGIFFNTIIRRLDTSKDLNNLLLKKFKKKTSFVSYAS